MGKIETIKDIYFHIKGMQFSSERNSMGQNPNYIHANLIYKTGKGYFWDIRPVHKYMMGDVEMVAVPFGVKIAEPRLEEALVKCTRKSANKEKEAREYFETNVASAITHRLKYRIEIAA